MGRPCVDPEKGGQREIENGKARADYQPDPRRVLLENPFNNLYDVPTKKSVLVEGVELVGRRW
jgi:hypothetical protein